MRLRLPPGYQAHPDPEVLVLLRADASVVGRFSRLGFSAEEAERVAWEDHADNARGPSSLGRTPS